MERDLLLEIGTEEIPSRFMPNALRDLAAAAEEEFAVSRIEHGRIETMGTPRRLVLKIHSVAENQNDQSEEYRGPARKNAFDAVGTPTRAAEGFARSRGVAVEDLQVREVNGIEYTFAVINHKGGPADALLPEIMVRAISRIVFPKNMYWHAPTVRFARPIRWILCLLGTEVVQFQLGDLKSGRRTCGHRFMGAQNLEIKSADDYLSVMYDNNVIVDGKKREEKMRERIAQLEKNLDGIVELDPALIQENLYLVEYPVPFFGSFDKKYLDIPSEVLTTSMKDNQKYFAVHDEGGELLPCFVGVSNNRVPDMNLVREGNERVLRARLEDAVFFWNEDLKRPLASRLEDLKNVIYQEQLGSVYDKTIQVLAISHKICDLLGNAQDFQLIERAALLSKTDLVTGMVGEFPELQGIMGREYALAQGENPRVAKALAEQYMPKAAGSQLPTDTIGATIGIAERAFNMLGAYKLGFQPTGSQDPYGLRRAVRSINEIIWGLQLDLDLGQLLAWTAKELQVDDGILDTLMDFIRTRTLIQLKEKEYPHQLVEVALTVTGNMPLQTLRLLNAIAEAKNEEWFSDLANSALRVKNILAKIGEIHPEIDTTLFERSAEKTLYDALRAVTIPVETAMEKHNWTELMNLLAQLTPHVSKFFEDVMVMSDDTAVRMNRLALLSLAQELFMRVGDLSRVK